MSTDDEAYADALLAAALAYAEAGLHVFPARVAIDPDSGKKNAQFLTSWATASTRGEQLIRIWFGPGGIWRGATLCIDCGRSQLVVVDCDGPTGITNWRALADEHHIGATWHAGTPGGGEHHYYRADPNLEVRNSAGELADNIDIRGAGGLVFAPPSRDARGRYQWRQGIPDWTDLPVVPHLVAEHKKPRTPSQPAAMPPVEPGPYQQVDEFFSGVHGGYSGGERRFTQEQAEEFVRPHLDALRTARDGTINDRLNRAALVAGHFIPHFWTRAQIEAGLNEALSATVYDGRTWKAENTIRSGLDAAARDWTAVKVQPRERTTPASGAGTSAAAPLANLPADFWDARPALQHIRQAAHARGRAADLVLCSALARLSAMVSHELKFDTGLGLASLNLFVAAVGPSGVGKSTGAKAAREIMEVPHYLAPSPDGHRIAFRDGIPVGSGEGLAETFMGTVIREIPGEFKANGDPKTEKVRGQVRHNAFVYIDEGETLAKMTERSGATIGPTIRSAWNAELLGQANAREETTRLLPAGSYSLGMLIGFQRSTALPLLAETGPGTPQRFLWCSAIDPTVPDEPIAHPGPLYVALTDTMGRPITGEIPFDQQIRDELWQRNLARVHGDVEDDDLDSHVPLMRAKLAALLAVLDGRFKVTVDDWELSAVIWSVSSAVRDALVAHGKVEEARSAEARTQAAIERAVRTHAEVGQVDRKLDRIARRLAEKVTAAGGLTTHAAKQSLPNRDRLLYQAAIDHGAAVGLLRLGTEGLLPPLRAA